MIFGMYFEIFEEKIKKILNTHIYNLLLNNSKAFSLSIIMSLPF